MEDYGGTKSILISTRTVMGGKNPFLGIAYIVVGGLCILLGAVFTATHLIKPRSVGCRSLRPRQLCMLTASAGNLATTLTYRGITTSLVRQRQPDAAVALVIPHKSDERPSQMGKGAGRFDRFHVLSFKLRWVQIPGCWTVVCVLQVIGSGFWSPGVVPSVNMIQNIFSFAYVRPPSSLMRSTSGDFFSAKLNSASDP